MFSYLLEYHLRGVSFVKTIQNSYTPEKKFFNERECVWEFIP